MAHGLVRTCIRPPDPMVGWDNTSHKGVGCDVRVWKEFKFKNYNSSACLEMADLIKGAGIAEDEINGALNKAITEIVNAVMIIKRVLTTIKTTIVKRSISP